MCGGVQWGGGGYVCMYINGNGAEIEKGGGGSSGGWLAMGLGGGSIHVVYMAGNKDEKWRLGG